MEEVRKAAKKEVRAEQKAAWAAFREPIETEHTTAVALLRNFEGATADAEGALVKRLEKAKDSGRGEVHAVLRGALLDASHVQAHVDETHRKALEQW